MKNFNGDAVDQFRLDFEKGVKDFEEKYGVKLNLGGIRYSAKQLSGKLTVTIVEAGVNPEDAMNKQSIKQHGWKFGLTEDDFDKRIEFLGEVFKLKGIKAIKQRCPIIALRSDGQMFKLPAHCLKK